MTTAAGGPTATVTRMPEPATMPEPAAALAEIDRLVGEVMDRGVRRVHVLAWRDLDDRDAGGSEVHADEFMRRWAAAGLDIVHRTSAAAGLPATDRRHGYDVVRRGSRYTVFPRTAVSELTGRMGRSDGLVEVWNGVPWFSPVWYRRPHITILHHVHGPMWDQIMPGPLAGAGRLLEARLAPPFYRSSEVVTPSEATPRRARSASVCEPERVTAVDNGVDPYFNPGDPPTPKSPTPLVVAAGRMAPVKRFGLLLEAAAEARRQRPRPPAPVDRRWSAAHGAGGLGDAPTARRTGSTCPGTSIAPSCARSTGERGSWPVGRWPRDGA